MLSYVRRDLLHNPRRTFASLAGVTLGVGLFAGVLFFMDASGATLTDRALAPLTLDMQRVLTSPLGAGIRLSEELSAAAALEIGDRATITLTVTNDGAEWLSPGMCAGFPCGTGNAHHPVNRTGADVLPLGRALPG